MTTITLAGLFDSQWIGGAWTTSDADTSLPVINPSDEIELARVPAGTAVDADRAVAAAVSAFETWSTTPVVERLVFLERFVAALEARTDALASIITDEVGAPLHVARSAQVGLAVAIAASYLEITRQYEFESQVGNSLVTHEAAGVVACITPWNVPLILTVQKIVPALMAGCTIVHKPSEVTPLHAYVLADIIAECDLPPGVYNMVVGEGPVVGAALARSRAVDVVSLTGSTRAGREVARLGADTVKRLHLELGGKNASIVLDDADLERAVQPNVDQMCFNSGQTCLQWSRLLVPRARNDEAVELAASSADGYVVGHPREPGTDLGPLASIAAYDRVTGYIRAGIAEGARLVAGGPERPAGLEQGFYVRPTVFADVDNSMVIAQDEIFGPVLSVIPYESEADAVRIANETEYGLHGAVWSGSSERAVAVARRLRTGLVDINGGTFNPLAPFGGVRQSGIGRECGVAGLESFLETKALQLPTDDLAAVGPRLRT